MTAAAMACSSSRLPRSTSAEPASSTWIVASSAAATDVPTKQHHLHAGDRHADVARRLGVAAGAEDPVPEHRGPAARRSRRRRARPTRRSRRRSRRGCRRRCRGANRRAPRVRSATPGYGSVSRRDSPIVAPLSANSMPSVTMNDGRPVVTTTQPLNSPIEGGEREGERRCPPTAASRTRSTVIAMIMPAAPTIEPTDRSNSPAIISSATGTPTMPICAATSRYVAAPVLAQEPVVARGDGEDDEHQRCSRRPAAISGRVAQRAQRPDAAGARRGIGPRHPLRLDCRHRAISGCPARSVR